MGRVMRSTGLVVVLLLAVVVLGIMITNALSPPAPGTAASFRALSAANSSGAPAFSVPMEARRSNADSCVGYNLELEEAAGIQRRINDHAEAERLLRMRQDCSVATAPVIRSAR